MKKILLTSILTLILFTSLVKNSTKQIEDNIFTINETIRSLKAELSDAMLEYNYLSSPEILTRYQSEYFENNLLKIDVTKIKKVTLDKDYLKITDLVEKKSKQ